MLATQNPDAYHYIEALEKERLFCKIHLFAKLRKAASYSFCAPSPLYLKGQALTDLLIFANCCDASFRSNSGCSKMIYFFSNSIRWQDSRGCWKVWLLETNDSLNGWLQDLQVLCAVMHFIRFFLWRKHMFEFKLDTNQLKESFFFAHRNDWSLQMIQLFEGNLS